MNKIAGCFHDCLIDFSSCKMRESKTIPFPLHIDIKTCFELIHVDVWALHHQLLILITSVVTFIDDNS